MKKDSKIHATESQVRNTIWGLLREFRDATREQKIAYECMTGNERFYKSLGINTEEIKETAIRQIKSKYIKN